MKKIFPFILFSLFLLSGCTSSTSPINHKPRDDRPAQTVEATTTPAKVLIDNISNKEGVNDQIANEDSKVDIVVAPNGTYTNVDGNEVARPYVSPSRPVGASAICRDGSYSFSQHRQGTCSGHGGVAEWY